jgi:predicted regulator of Ras-like GTPase activity (Roadblock/LC7/MglB family)
MADSLLAEAAAEIPSLRSVLVITMPDCLLFSSWAHAETSWSVEDASSYFGDLVRANRRGLGSIGAWSTDMQVTIESADALIVLREIDENFVCCAMFDRQAPLGMVRLQLKMLLNRISTILPKVALEERPRGVRFVEFLERYAPDPHAVLLRVATRTGISMDALRDAGKLTPAQVTSLEEAAKRILGLEQINI